MRLLFTILGHCLYQAIRHPMTPIEVYGNPTVIPPQSAIPWWGSVGVIIVGIVSWCISAVYGIEGLDEAARAMVYIPLGNIFGMSLQLRAKQP